MTVDIERYLRRIGHLGPAPPTLETLRTLHRRRLFGVPFENLDIHAGRAIMLDEARLLEKIADRRRGGFCYELNGAFAALPRALGFEVKLLSASVARPDGGFGPEHDHLLPRVDLDEPWLADVSFGDGHLGPLRLAPGVQREGSRAFEIVADGERRVLRRRDGAGDWQPQYSFSLTPRALSDSAAMCRHLQTSSDSHFTRNRVCLLATPTGRVSLTPERLFVTDGERREERLIPDANAYHDALRRWFGVVVD